MNTADDDPPLAVTLEPLTRRNRHGDLYTRDPDVERQIAEALTLRQEALRMRVAINDRGSPDYLKEECLVYLLRHYHRGDGDEGRVSDIAAALVRRNTRIIRRHLRSLGAEALEEGYSEVVARLFRKILDVATDKADFFQVRFWFAMKRICIQVFDTLLAQRDRGRKEVPLSDVPGYDDDEYAEPETKPLRLTEEDKRRVSAPSNESAIIESDLRREARRVALTQLEEPFRSAYMLRHCHGWPVEHQDPTVRTISRHFGRTPRTIRNWLTTAEETLARWRGGQK